MEVININRNQFEEMVREGTIRAVFNFLSAFTYDKVRIARTVFVLI